MKPDGVLTNTSRSNEDDLLVHLKSILASGMVLIFSMANQLAQRDCF